MFEIITSRSFVILSPDSCASIPQWPCAICNVFFNHFVSYTHSVGSSEKNWLYIIMIIEMKQSVFSVSSLCLNHCSNSSGHGWNQVFNGHAGPLLKRLNLDPSDHTTRFHCSTVQILCSLTHWSRAVLWRGCNKGFLRAILPFSPAVSLQLQLMPSRHVSHPNVFQHGCCQTPVPSAVLHKNSILPRSGQLWPTRPGLTWLSHVPCLSYFLIISLTVLLGSVTVAAIFLTDMELL